MNDVFEAGRLYAQLDDYLALSQAQLVRLMARAEQHPAAFNRFDLPRLAIGCRPGDRAAVERLLPLLQHPQVRAHPGWIELVVEVIGAMESCSPQVASPVVGDLECRTVRELYNVVGPVDVLLPWLQPAAVAALLDVTPGVAVRLLRQQVVEACIGQEQACLERFVASFGIGSFSELQQIRECDDDPLHWEHFELADCAREGWSSPELIDLTFQWLSGDSGEHDDVPTASAEVFRQRFLEGLPDLSERLAALIGEQGRPGQ